MNTSITNIQDNVFFMAVPEPSTFALVVVGLTIGLVALRRRVFGANLP